MVTAGVGGKVGAGTGTVVIPGLVGWVVKFVTLFLGLVGFFALAALAGLAGLAILVVFLVGAFLSTFFGGGGFGF